MKIGSIPLSEPKVANDIAPPKFFAQDSTSYATDRSFLKELYGYVNDAYCDVPHFIGFPALAQLAQRTEYRAATEILATEATRCWIKLCGSGDMDDKITELEEAIDKFKVKETLKKAMYNDGFFGRGQIYIDIDGVSDEEKSKPLAIDKAQIGKDGLLGFTSIEPMWTSPIQYNTTHPEQRDFFVPQTWQVFGRQIHTTRMITIIARPLPDMLKPAYGFSGMSLSQLMTPAVENYLSNSHAVGRLITKFSKTALKTDMEAALTSGENDGDGYSACNDLKKRVQLWSNVGTNDDVVLLDFLTEDLINVSVPLNTLDVLLQQSIERMAMPSHIPLVKLLGITPAGLNANSDGEIRVFYDYVAAMQESVLREALTTMIHAIMLHLWGDIEEGITFKFNSLHQMSDLEAAQIRKINAEVGAQYQQDGVITNQQEFERIARDPMSGYDNLELDDIPELYEEPEPVIAAPGQTKPTGAKK